MNRVEFIEKLQRALAGGLNSNQVMDHVRYYREYIDTEMRKGRSEADVLAGLGDPRLLAKSIIEANKQAGAGEGTNRTYDEEMTGTDNTYRHDAYNGRTFHIPGWLILLIVTVAVILVIGIAFSLISLFAPIIIPVLIVILLVWVFKRDQ